MAMNYVEKVKELRSRTGLGLFDCKRALESTDWNVDEALAKLQPSSVTSSEKVLREGVLHSYNHGNRIAVIVEVRCETDFAARGAAFLGFAASLGMQIAATGPVTLDDILTQPWVEDEKQTVGQLLESLKRVLREEVRITRFVWANLNDGWTTIWPSQNPTAQ